MRTGALRVTPCLHDVLVVVLGIRAKIAVVSKLVEGSRAAWNHRRHEASCTALSQAHKHTRTGCHNSDVGARRAAGTGCNDGGDGCSIQPTSKSGYCGNERSC